MSEALFRSESTAFFEELLCTYPTFASYLGDHRFDALFGEYTQESVVRNRKKLQLWLEKFQSFSTESWTIDNKIDCILLVQYIKAVKRTYETFYSLNRNPGFAVEECLGGIHTLIIRDFAPLEVRLQSVLGRLQDVSRVIDECKLLIEPPEVPFVWAEVAIESANAGIGFFSIIIPDIAKIVPELQYEIAEAGKAAAEALQNYVLWIEHEILPVAKGDFATGKELFNELLRENHMVNYDSDELLIKGWQLIDATEAEMKKVAESINPGKTASQILEECKNDHPSAENLLSCYQNAMLQARQFAIGHRLVSIPDGESIRIEPTPSFLVNLIPFAAYVPPGFMEKIQEGVFWVTQPGENNSFEEIEKKLRSHPHTDIHVTALHEAYPGHHLQFVVANRSGSKIRKLGAMLSTLFIEGWAFYCEELMEEQGFISQPIQKLSRLQAQLWRALRIVIDVSLHTRKMNIDEAIDLLVKRAGLEPEDARAEVHRYTLSPTQPQSYLMGKMEILKIVQKYKELHPGVDLCKMHDDILACGPLPPALMQVRLS